MNIEDLDDETKEFIEKVEKNISDFFINKRDNPKGMLTGLATLSCVVEAKFQLTANAILGDKDKDLLELRDNGVQQIKDNFTSNIAMGLIGKILDGFDERDEE